MYMHLPKYGFAVDCSNHIKQHVFFPNIIIRGTIWARRKYYQNSKLKFKNYISGRRTFLSVLHYTKKRIKGN
jgi:hypothetical protein